MKKIISVALVLLTVLFAFASCGTASKLNKLLEADAAKITVVVETATALGTLKSSYVVENGETETKITYEEQIANTFDLDDAVPTEAISTVSGNVVIKGGKVVEQNGKKASITLKALTNTGLVLDEGNLTDIVDEEGKYSAKVVDAKAFLGTEDTVTDLSVEITYTDDAISTVVLNYKNAAANAVKLTYTFG